MKKIGKITLALVAVCSIFVLVSCSFYSANNATAAFELVKDTTEDTGMKSSMTYQVAFNKDGTCTEDVKIKVGIFSFKADAEGTWEALIASPDQSWAAGKMTMSALELSILGETEEIQDEGTYYWYVYNDKLYLGGTEANHASIVADPSQLETKADMALSRVFPN